MAGCSRCSLARRLDVTGTRMHCMGKISPRHLAQIWSVLLPSAVRDGFYGGYNGGFDLDFA